MKRSHIPPLGPKPRYIIEEERITELKGAISRYLDANWPIPTAVIEEYNELTNRLPDEEEQEEHLMKQMKSLREF